MLIEAELILLENWSQIHFQRRSFGENWEKKCIFQFQVQAGFLFIWRAFLILFEYHLSQLDASPDITKCQQKGRC